MRSESASLRIPLGSSSLILEAGPRDWCRVYIDDGDGPPDYIGSESLRRIRERLQMLASGNVSAEVGQIDGIPVFNILNLAEPHAALYASRTATSVRLFVQDKDLTITHRLSATGADLLRLSEALASRAQQEVTFAQKARAHFVHLYTAFGVAFAFLAAVEVASATPDPRWVFLWLLIAVLIDATDGPLARAWHVKFRAPRFDGRKIDDIVDYLTFTFLPLLLVWRMGWLPPPAVAWIIPALVASILGFANVAAKQEDAGFFLGFPSYWNIYAFYAGLWYLDYGRWLPAVVLVVLTVLSILPVRFLYPNLAPRPWRWPMLLGAGLWTVLLVLMLPTYPDVPAWLVWLSAVYPAFYVALSVCLDARARQSATHG